MTAELAIADALVPPTPTSGPVLTRVLAISANGDPVGYLVVAEPGGEGGHPCLWRIVIDYRHGGRGIEKLAVGELARFYGAAGHSQLDAYYHTRQGGLGRMFHAIGFAPVGQHGDAELARLDLAPFSD